METKVSRRQLITMLGTMAGAGAAGTLLAHAEAPAVSKPGSLLQQTPWPYKPLEPEKVAQRAFESFQKGRCMYGSFEAIAGSVAEQLGVPYTDFPFAMFKYGEGGVYGWATLCGSLNGSAAAIQLLSPNPVPLIDALFAWYEAEPLPNFSAKGMKFKEVRSAAGTPLCHASIAHWTKASGKTAYSPERAERCATLTASAAFKAITLLNEQAAAKPIAFAIPAETKGCMSCHEKGGAVEDIRTKMNCGECHEPEVKNQHGKA
jgi:hypothetical protein